MASRWLKIEATVSGSCWHPRGLAPSGTQAGWSASHFQHSRTSPAACRSGLRSVPPPLESVQRVSLPICVDLTDSGVFPCISVPGVITGALSPGSVELPAVLEVKMAAATGTMYPMPDGVLDNELLTEIGRPIMDAPILDGSKLTLQWPCPPRRSVSVVDLENLSGDGPIRSDMTPLMKVRSCNPRRADPSVGIMMTNVRYAIPPAPWPDRMLRYEPRDAAYLDLPSAMLFEPPGDENFGEIFPIAMLPNWWQFPLPGLPKMLDGATRTPVFPGPGDE